MIKLQNEENALKSKDLEVQKSLIEFGNALENLTKKSKAAAIKAKKENDVLVLCYAVGKR